MKGADTEKFLVEQIAFVRTRPSMFGSPSEVILTLAWLNMALAVHRYGMPVQHAVTYQGHRIAHDLFGRGNTIGFSGGWEVPDDMDKTMARASELYARLDKFLIEQYGAT